MVDIERHAEAVLRALMIGNDEEPTDKPRIMAILTALADDAAGEMREKAYEACLDCQSEALNNRGAAAIAIRAIPLPSEGK